MQLPSQSDLLRLRHTRDGGGKNISNKKSKGQEKAVSNSSTILLQTLQQEYPAYNIRWIKSILCIDFRPTNVENPRAAFSPDGGIFLGTRPDGTDFYVLSTESKKQGTNDQRLLEGKSKQAKGNAIERAPKNFCELDLLLEDQTAFAYLVCCCGSDFHKGSTIRDRIGSMCRKDPYNVLYSTRDNRGRSRASVMFREQKWEEHEIVEMGLTLAREVIAIECNI